MESECKLTTKGTTNMKIAVECMIGKLSFAVNLSVKSVFKGVECSYLFFLFKLKQAFPQLFPIHALVQPLLCL